MFGKPSLQAYLVEQLLQRAASKNLRITSLATEA